MVKVRFWFRWSRRDLRARWLQVTAIALIIALGTGVYAGLVSSTPWRDQSLDDSYALLNMYDLRVRLTGGSYIETNQLLSALSTIPHADQIEAIEPRLIEPTLVQASTENDTILVPGQIIGVSVADGGPLINLDAPNVAKANENTTWPTSADSTVAKPTSCFAVWLGTAWPKVCEPIT
jgi:putative ABC transport system permease protein